MKSPVISRVYALAVGVGTSVLPALRLGENGNDVYLSSTIRRIYYTIETSVKNPRLASKIHIVITLKYDLNSWSK